MCAASSFDRQCIFVVLTGQTTGFFSVRATGWRCGEIASSGIARQVCGCEMVCHSIMLGFSRVRGQMRSGRCQRGWNCLVRQGRRRLGRGMSFLGSRGPCALFLGLGASMAILSTVDCISRGISSLSAWQSLLYLCPRFISSRLLSLRRRRNPNVGCHQQSSQRVAEKTLMLKVLLTC